MTDHQIIGRRILTVGGSLFLALVLIGIGAGIGDGNRSFYFYTGAAVILFILGFVSARWFLSALQAVTGMTLFLSMKAVGFVYLLGALFAPVILPIGLIVLVLQYALARRRFHRDVLAVRAQQGSEGPKTGQA